MDIENSLNRSIIYEGRKIEYCLERNNSIDAENFIDYYNSNGWKVGKNPMKDWKAAIRTWEKRNKKEVNNAGSVKQSNKQNGSKYAQFS